MKSHYTPKYILPEASNVIRALRPDLVDLFDRVRDREVARAKDLYDRVCAELDSIETQAEARP